MVCGRFVKKASTNGLQSFYISIIALEDDHIDVKHHKYFSGNVPWHSEVSKLIGEGELTVTNKSI